MSKEGKVAKNLYLDEYRRLFQAYNHKFKVKKYMSWSKSMFQEKLKELKYEPFFNSNGKIDLRPTKDMMRRPVIKANLGGRAKMLPAPPKPKPRPRGRPKGAKNKKGTKANPNPNFKK